VIAIQAVVFLASIGGFYLDLACSFH